MRISRGIAFAAALLFAAPAFAATVVIDETMDSAARCDALRAAVAANVSTVEVNADVSCPTTVVVSGRAVLIRGMGRVFGASGPVFTVTGIRVHMEQIEVWNDSPAGVGVLIQGGGRVYLRAMQINTRGVGVSAASGAGLWTTDVHFNGFAPGSGTVGITLGQWDTAYFNGVLIEEHDVGVRPGWNGHSANLLVGNIAVDRALVGMQIDPVGGGSIANVLVSTLWAACRPNPPSYAAGVSALAPWYNAVSTIRFAAIYATGCPKGLTSYGTFTGAGLSVGWSYPSP